MLQKTRLILLLVTVYISNGLVAQINPISNLDVEQLQNWTPDSTEVVSDSMVVSMVTITFAQLDPAATIHIQSGSGPSMMDGLDEEFSIVFFKNSYLLRDMSGSFCSELVGNKMNLVFSVHPTDESKYQYWNVWLEFPDAPSSAVVTYQIR